MKSKIRIEYDFETKEPILRIIQNEDSDDLRDQMLKSFLQKAWKNRLSIIYPEYIDRRDNHIVEIRCEEIPETEKRTDSLFSRFGIGDEVEYSTDEWMQEAFNEARALSPELPDEKIEYVPKYSHGKVVAIRFTRAKVWYDILDDITGEVVRDVVSHQTKLFSTELK